MTLESVCEFVVDCPHSTPEWTDCGVFVFRNWNIRGGRIDFARQSFTTEDGYQARIKRAEPQAGDIIVTREAPMGEAAIIPEGLRGCLGQRLVLLRPNPKMVDRRYLLYSWMSPYVQGQIRVHDGTGSTVSNLRIPVLKKLDIPMKSVQEQKAIASILGALDDKIDLNRRMNETLESMARALYKSWFVDFDPVVAKAAGKRPFGMDDATAALFPDRFVDSELGPIPEGWEVSHIGDLIEINPRVRMKKGEIAPYLSMQNVAPFRARPTAWEWRALSSGVKFSNDDVLMARITPSLENGKTVYVDFLPDGHNGWGSTEFLVLRSRGYVGMGFIYFMATSNDLRDVAIASMVGSSGRQRVQNQAIVSFPVAMPMDRRQLDLFERQCRPMFEMKKANDNESQTLAQLRDLLLPKLISGEIRIKDAEKAVGEVV